MASSNVRAVKDVYVANPTLEGAGVHLKRAFGQAEVPDFDPFLLLDDFRSDTPADYLAGFPWHPHRGIETVTYVLDGRVEHMDNMGNRGVIQGGDVQWMTAGSGIVHQEMPKPIEKKRMAGFQLWLNLPKVQKMRDPRYQEVPSAGVPEIEVAKGVRARLVAGRLGDVQGPVQDMTVQPEFMDVRMKPGAKFEHPIPRGHTAFAYILEGRGRFGGPHAELFDAETVVSFADGDHVSIRTDARPVRYFLVSGKPLGEPISWWGPIVMNSHREIEHALSELAEGTFIKARGQAGALSHREQADAVAGEPHGSLGRPNPGPES